MKIDLVSFRVNCWKGTMLANGSKITARFITHRIMLDKRHEIQIASNRTLWYFHSSLFDSLGCLLSRSLCRNSTHSLYLSSEWKFISPVHNSSSIVHMPNGKIACCAYLHHIEIIISAAFVTQNTDSVESVSFVNLFSLIAIWQFPFSYHYPQRV